MKLPYFLFIEPQDQLKGAGFVLCTEPPFIMGKVYKFRTVEEQNDFFEKSDSHTYSHVNGYRISICFFSSLLLINDQKKQHEKELYFVIEDMCSYYLTDKISQHEPAFTRYKKR